MPCCLFNVATQWIFFTISMVITNNSEPIISIICVIFLPAGCRDDEYKCVSGKCIEKKLKCNGDDDCGDRSDEMDCGRSIRSFML